MSKIKLLLCVKQMELAAINCIDRRSSVQKTIGIPNICTCGCTVHLRAYNYLTFINPFVFLSVTQPDPLLRAILPKSILLYVLFNN